MEPTCAKLKPQPPAVRPSVQKPPELVPALVLALGRGAVPVHRRWEYLRWSWPR